MQKPLESLTSSQKESVDKADDNSKPKAVDTAAETAKENQNLPKKKNNRRKAAEIERAFICPISSCGKAYGYLFIL